MLAKLKLFTSSDFFKGSAILTISAFLANVFNYFFNFVIGRTLGPSGFGEITAIFSYAYIFSVPMSVAAAVIIQKIGSANNKMERAVSLEHLFWEKIKRFWYLYIFVIIAPFLFSRISNLSISSSIFFFLMITVSFISCFYSSALRGLKIFLFAGIVSTLAVSIKFSGALLTFIAIFKSVPTVLVFILLSSVIEFILIYFYFAKKKQNCNCVKIEKRMLHIVLNPQIIITTISLLGIALLNNADIIFVKKFYHAGDAGLYSAWSLFAKIIFYALGPIIAVAYIFFTEKNDSKNNKFVPILWIIFFTIVGISSYAIYSLFSKEIISLLFGARYLKITPQLGLAGIFGTLYTVIVFFNNYFLAKKSKYAYIVAIVLPFYLIGLFFSRDSISAVMNTNIIFSGFISFCYLLAFLKKNPV